jgi:hypothetical protein
MRDNDNVAGVLLREERFHEGAGAVVQLVERLSALGSC